MIGNRLKEIRKELKLSQTDLANKLNLASSMAVSYYESDKREPNLNILVNISELFNINLNWLLTGNGEMLITDMPTTDLSVEDSELLEAAKELVQRFSPKTIKVPNHAAPKNRPPESLAKDKPLDIIDNNVSKGQKLIDLHKVTAKKMSGYVAAGYGADGGEYVECIISADQVLGRSGEDLFSFTVVGESMLYAGIYPGDLIMVCPTETPKIGDLVLAKTTDGLTVKNYQKDNEGRFVLHPDNYHFPDIVIDKTVQIIGVVMSAVRIFKR